MRVSHLKIQNFRSVEILDEDIPQVCALVGANNVGKSNILEALRRVLERDYISINNFADADFPNYDTDKELSIKVTVDPPIPYDVFKSFSDTKQVGQLVYRVKKRTRGENKGALGLDTECLSSNGADILVLKEVPKAGKKHEYKPLLGIPREVKEAIPLIYIGADRSLRKQLPSYQNSLLGRLFEGIHADFSNSSNLVNLKDRDGNIVSVQRAEQFKKLIEKAMKLLRTPEFEKLENLIKTNALRQLGLDAKNDAGKLDFFFTPPSASDFYKSLELFVKEDGFQINATALGAGFQNVLVLSIMQAYEALKKKGAIFLIEEPEIYLHPQTQRSLYQTLKEIGKENQVIYTTHSPHFVEASEPENIILVRKDKVTTVQRSKIVLGNGRKEKLKRTSNASHNEMFFAKKVLIVEGDTEEHAFPAWASKLGVCLDSLGYSVIDAGGKNNIIDYAEICRSLGIETHIVFDTDIPSRKSDANEKLTEEKAAQQKNGELADFCNKNCVTFTSLPQDYESYLKSAVGNEVCAALEKKYSEYGNRKQKQRQIALDPDLATPEVFKQIIQKLVGTQPNDSDDVSNNPSDETEATQ